MSLRHFPPTNCNVEDDPLTTTVPTGMHSLTGRASDSESERPPEYSPTDTLGAVGASQATPNSSYIYYRIYAEDGAIPSKTRTLVAPSDPFLGRIKVRSVPPPRTVKAVKRSITKVENIKDHESTTIFLTPYSQSPMDDAEKVTILNGIGPGSTPQDPLALVAKMSDSERTVLESDGTVGLANPAESEIRYVYYLLYADGYEIPSKVANDPEEPSLGRIRADSIAPPHTPTTIKRCISRVERNRALSYADLFADTSCDTPLTEGHISILRTDGPGLSPNEPMAIVQTPVKAPSISDGKYVIKNQAADIYWSAGGSIDFGTVYFRPTTMEDAKKYNHTQWDITQDAYGNISMTSPYAPSSWVGAEIEGSSVPVSWRPIPAHSYCNSFYLTTDIFRVSQNPRVPAAQENLDKHSRGEMATLKIGDKWQMWEFIRI